MKENLPCFIRLKTIRRLFISIFLLIILTPILYAVSPSPELIEKFKENGELQKLVDRMASLPRNYYPEYSNHRPDKSDPQTIDTARIVIILVDFDDNPSSGGGIDATPDDFDQLILSFDENDTQFSFAEFYYENSYGTYIIEGTVAGWYRMQYSYADYINMYGSYQLAIDAAMAADADIDYSQYDGNNDGWVDGIILVHAGPGAEQTGSDNMIWSHMSTYSNFNLDGIQLVPYCFVPEEYQGAGLISIGVITHEYGHVIWLPDLYDTDYSSSGIGEWSLMAGGSWNMNGQRPAFLDPWCKKELGFIDLINLTGNTIDTEVPASIYNPVAYRLWENGNMGNQYFIIENRQKTGYDSGIPGSGILIFHIDESIGGNWDENHPLVAIEQADGNFDLENGSNRGDGGDVWSTATKTEFNEITTPDSRKYNGQSTKTAVWNIPVSDSIMYANFDINYSRPYFILTNSAFSDSPYGNDNGVIEEGETITFTFFIVNQWLTATNVTGLMTSDNIDIVFSTSSVNIGTVSGNGGGGGNYSSPLVFTIPESFDPCIDSFYLSITSDNPWGDIVFGFELQIGTPEVLVIDDDDGDTWQETITNELTKLLIPHDVYDKSIFGAPTTGLMNNYSIVIWLTGDDRPDILSTADVDAMKGFMDNGGNFFLTGQAIIGELATDDPAFLNNYLKADYIQDLLYPFIYGQPGTVIGDGLSIRYDSWTNQVRPQTMTPINGSVSEFELPIGGTMGLSFQGDYKLVLFSFGFEGISNSYIASGFTSQDTVLTRIIQFFNFGVENQFSNPNVDTVSVEGESSLLRLVNHSPIFNWNVSDTTVNPIMQYQAQVGTGVICNNVDNIWDTGILNGNDTVITYAGSPLLDGNSYIFRVRVYNGVTWSNWYRLPFQMNSVGQPIELLEPADNSLVSTATPDLTVTNTADPDGDLLAYQFGVYTDSLLTNMVTSVIDIPSGVTVTTWTVDVSLSEDQKYFWRSRAFDGYELTDYSSVASFYVNAINQAPNSFSLLLPADEEESVGLNPTLIWGSSTDNDAGDIISYSLRLSLDSLFGSYTEVNNISDTSHTLITGLELNKQYFWKVKAIDLANAETWSSETFSFYTGSSGCCLGIRGNIDGDPDDQIDIADLVYFVDYSFSQPPGPEPPCPDEADVDGSGTTDIVDIVYMVDYMFSQPPGPNPVDCLLK